MSPPRATPASRVSVLQHGVEVERRVQRRRGARSSAVSRSWSADAYLAHLEQREAGGGLVGEQQDQLDLVVVERLGPAAGEHGGPAHLAAPGDRARRPTLRTPKRSV